jgi:hypothetical protein
MTSVNQEHECSQDELYDEAEFEPDLNEPFIQCTVSKYG